MSPTASSSAWPRCSIEVMMLSADQCRSLRCLAEMMIPASAEYGVPECRRRCDLRRYSAEHWARCGTCDRGAGIARRHVRRPVRRSGPATARCHRCPAARDRWRGLGVSDPHHPAMLLPDDGSCGRWAWNRGRRFPKASRWNKATGRCWIRCARARSFIATPVDGNSLPARQQHSQLERRTLVQPTRGYALVSSR